MSEGSLKLSIKWLRMFAEGKELVDAGRYDEALPVLENALAVIEVVDEMLNAENPDNRVAENLERIAFVYQQQGYLIKAEPLYRRAMEIANTHVLGVHLRMAIYQNLAKLLIDTGREDEGQALLARYPLEGGVGEVARNPFAEGDGIEAAVDAFADAAVAFAESSVANSKAIVIPSLDGSMLMSLNTLAFMYRDTAPKVLSLMGEILDHIEFCYGTLSNEFAEGAQKIANGYVSTCDVSDAQPYLHRALLAKLSAGGDDNEIARLAVDLAMCDRESDLSKALVAKYHRPARFDDPLTLAKSIMSKIAGAQGVAAEPLPTAVAANSVDGEEAEKTIEEWRQSQANTIKPPAFMNQEDRYRQFLPLAERAVALAQEVEADDSHPFSTVCLLSDKSKLHLELGEKTQALKCKKLELDTISSHWGEGHAMTVEAHIAFTQMQEET